MDDDKVMTSIKAVKSRESHKAQNQLQFGQVGALNAENYAERVNSMGKLVLTDGSWGMNRQKCLLFFA
jgi:hypothetical protein